MKKFLIIVLIIAALSLMFSFCDSSSDNSYDDAMASQDWGRDYYYNRNSHQVEKNLHGILN